MAQVDSPYSGAVPASVPLSLINEVISPFALFARVLSLYSRQVPHCPVKAPHHGPTEYKLANSYLKELLLVSLSRAKPSLSLLSGYIGFMDRFQELTGIDVPDFLAISYHSNALSPFKLRDQSPSEI